MSPDPIEPISGAIRPASIGFTKRAIMSASELHRSNTMNAAVEMPSPLQFSDAAAAKVKQLIDEEGNSALKLRVFVQGGGCSGFQYGLMIEENGQGAADQVYESHGVKLFIDPISIQYLKGAEVDFVDTITGGGFTIKNPNATSTCGCGQSFTTD